MKKRPADEDSQNGARYLPGLRIDSYNVEIRASGKFIGDRASGRAFRALLEHGRRRVRKVEEDPIGEIESAEISKKALNQLLLSGDVEAAGVVLGTIEEFSQRFANVICRFMRLESWKKTRRIVVGGGLRASRIGELAIGRTSVLLKHYGRAVDLVPIRYHPDEAGLIGCLQLAPGSLLKGQDGILAVDIGGANIRAGIVTLNSRTSRKLAASKVFTSELWRHADDEPGRDDAVARLVDMLAEMIKRAAKAKLRLAPFVGVGCPGVIRADGTIKKGAQNLPGNWEHREFNLPALLRQAIPKIGSQSTHVVMHNDAVVQGLSEVPFMREVKHWGVMTIGSGLGNARFTNR
jgi:predicted NBD/HSP70 family sugar kinase